FEQVVEALHPARTPGQTPLVQVLFTLQGAPLPPLELAGLRLTARAAESGTAKFDLAVELAETAEGLWGSIEYRTNLFDAATVARLAAHFQVLLAGIAADPTRRIATLPILTAAEQRQVHEAWNATAADYPRDAVVHELFEVQAVRTPDAVAVV